MHTYQIGILGCGVISRTYSADILSFFPKLHIAACADVNIAEAQKLADEFRIAKAYTTEELLQDEEIDIIINLTPPQFHVALNKRIILAGKHVFSEKPFAPDVETAKEVLELAEKKNVLVGCAPDTFLSSGLQSVRYYLDCGLIGKPFFVTANMTTFGVETWHPNPIPFYQKDSGPLFDMGPYYASAIVSLLGPVESIGAFSTKANESRHIYKGKNAGNDIPTECPTHYTAILRLTCGAVANLNISFDIYKSNLPMFEIYGDGGTLSYPDPNFGGGNPKAYRKEQYTDTIFQQSEDSMARKERFYELPELFPRVKDYFRGMGVLDLANAIETGERNRTGGEWILHITEVLQGIQKSAETGAFYRMKTTCERPRTLKPGGYIDRL